MPDTLSPAWNIMSHTTGVVDFPNVTSNFLTLGVQSGLLDAAYDVSRG